MNSVAIKCPHCLVERCSVEIAMIEASRRPNTRLKPRGTTHECIGVCQSCFSMITIYLRALASRDKWMRDIPPDLGLIMTNDVIRYPHISYLGCLPEVPREEVPADLPDNVARSYLEAEKARLAGLFTSAAKGYGKAVERGIKHLVPDDGKRRTLGQKLAVIRESGDLPTALQDWIGVVLADRNFAAHDDDKDFESAEEIAIMRDLANILLTYLYTLPAMVESARKSAKAREASGAA